MHHSRTEGGADRRGSQRGAFWGSKQKLGTHTLAQNALGEGEGGRDDNDNPPLRVGAHVQVQRRSTEGGGTAQLLFSLRRDKTTKRVTGNKQNHLSI
jgi:hypothetical protein